MTQVPSFEKLTKNVSKSSHFQDARGTDFASSFDFIPESKSPMSNLREEREGEETRRWRKYMPEI